MIKDFTITKFKGIEYVEMKDCGRVNAIIGKNNSGKSTILQAIDMAGLAVRYKNWNYFQPKIEIKDLFEDVGKFSEEIVFENGEKVTINAAGERVAPVVSNDRITVEHFSTALVMNGSEYNLLQRQDNPPRKVFGLIEQRNFSTINSLDILYTLKYYALRNERGLKQSDYEELISEVNGYFPSISEMDADRTDSDHATMTYIELGKKLDIIYSGSGLKSFLDVLVKTRVTRANTVLIDEPEAGLHPDLQRRFIEYICQFAEDKNIQVFIATHSQVLLDYADSVRYFKISNNCGKRSLVSIPSKSRHTLMNDLGIKPSDLFGQDICLMVEGQTDVIFFEHIIRELYRGEFSGVAVGIVQYGGSAAEGIINGVIKTSNIVPSGAYVYWIHDRDSSQNCSPSSNATKFKTALEKSNFMCHILKKREIEFYFPGALYETAQEGDQEKITKVKEILTGNQDRKFRKAAEDHQVCVPRGGYLKKLLRDHLKTKNELDEEILEIMNKLLDWKREIV